MNCFTRPRHAFPVPLARTAECRWRASEGQASALSGPLHSRISIGVTAWSRLSARHRMAYRRSAELARTAPTAPKRAMPENSTYLLRDFNKNRCKSKTNPRDLTNFPIPMLSFIQQTSGSLPFRRKLNLGFRPTYLTKIYYGHAQRIHHD